MKYIAGITALAVLMTGCGSSSSPSAKSYTRAHPVLPKSITSQHGQAGAKNRLIAQQAAMRDLTLLKLPRRALRVASEPRAVRSDRAFPTGTCYGPDNVNRADTACIQEWWLVPEGPQRVLAWIAAHLPGGWHEESWVPMEAPGGREGYQDNFIVPALAHVLYSGDMDVTVATATAAQRRSSSQHKSRG